MLMQWRGCQKHTLFQSFEVLQFPILALPVFTLHMNYTTKDATTIELTLQCRQDSQAKFRRRQVRKILSYFGYSLANNPGEPHLKPVICTCIIHWLAQSTPFPHAGLAPWRRCFHGPRVRHHDPTWPRLHESSLGTCMSDEQTHR